MSCPTSPIDSPSNLPSDSELASARLRALEASLEDEWAGLLARGFGYESVRDRLASFKSATPSASAERDPSEYLAEAALAQAQFLERLDEFQRVKHVYFIGQVVDELDRAMQSMDTFYGPRRIRRFRRRYAQLCRLAQRYRELEHLYGTPRDHRRIDVYQRFYAGVIAFSEEIRALDPTAPLAASSSWVDRAYRARRSLVFAFRHIGDGFRLVGAALGLLFVLLSKQSRDADTPFTRYVDRFFAALGSLRGERVDVSGEQNLSGCDSAERNVQLLTPAHRNGVLDNVTFSHLRLPDYLVFNAVDQLPGVPRFLKERAAQTPGLIAVGGNRGSSVERLVDALGKGFSRNVLIYPEGSVSEGFKGTRPPRDNFGEGLVRRVREAGYRLRIVPITYLDNARFLDLPPRSNRPDDHRLRVVVSTPLEDDAVGALLAAGGGPLINQMVRLAWLEELTTDAEHLLGQDRVEGIERRLDAELAGIRYWGSLEPAPVDDQLAIEGPDPITAREEVFRGKRVRVLQIPESARDERGCIPLPSLRDADSCELLIGVRKPSHIYLNVGRQRFDGDIFRKLALKERDFVYPGIVIRFSGVPRKSIHAIRRALDEMTGREQRTLTCANSACRLIARAANMRIDDHADMRPFVPSHVLPTRTMRKLIERGVRDHAGRRVAAQIYCADDRPLEDVLREMRRAELRIAWDHMVLLSVGGAKRSWRWLRGLRQRILDRTNSM